MAAAMVSAWTSMPTHLIFGFVGGEFMNLMSWNVERRDPASIQRVALVAARAMAHPRRLNSSPALKRPFSSHRV